MIRFARPAAALLLLSAACDFNGDDIVIQPEFDESFSFEGGFEEWVASGTDLEDPPVTWDIERTTEQASAGTSSVRLRLDNLNDQGKIWIERRFDVAESQIYSVEISFDLGTSDEGDVNLWTVLAGATPEAPTRASELTPRGDTGGGAGGAVTFLEKRYTSTVTSTDEGEVWIHVGVWGTWETSRAYYVDDVRVVFTRADPVP